MKKGIARQVRELRLRAEAGDADAQYELGCFYYEGEGVEQDYQEAFKWYMKAAEQGHNSGLCDVGFCYRNGHGVEQNYAKAIPYYEKAASQGCPTGAFWLGYAYEHGEGVARDIEKACYWYRISMARGDRDAAAALQRMQTEGKIKSTHANRLAHAEDGNG
ncbi:MAG: tetratricopeptide repeat protein [Kiritimatiellia bacterium]